ncbi:hypothetical protein DFA_07771 [Cavenderia fasciculata]|uniref:Proteasome assembly chaperone 4 n=1 Tax=Cavenderia fasciculata TaxID=261658 RepID=F4Q371_CACFS|nr:uncharacterized protein DFA_07771 [Cavenderia fasciculata]EGG16793.1 hypothetical protein DFA_07771 [Cavenderia fasciculata]|eukprot:XP_004355267.1 hypothetical protein DFA_07771 [Cavenderia fasciculata]
MDTEPISILNQNIDEKVIQDDSENSGLMIEKIVDSYENVTIYFLIYLFKEQDSTKTNLVSKSAPIFIWIGENVSAPSIDSLLVSMKTPMDNQPSLSEIFSSQLASNAATMIKRIVMKYNTQAFISYNISQDVPELHLYVEKRLFQLLNQYYAASK